MKAHGETKNSHGLKVYVLYYWLIKKRKAVILQCGNQADRNQRDES